MTDDVRHILSEAMKVFSNTCCSLIYYQLPPQNVNPLQSRASGDARYPVLHQSRVNTFTRAARDGDIETVKRMVEETPRIVKMIDTVRLCEMKLF